MQLTIDKATTNATGANWQAFADRGAELMKIFNSSGTTIEYRVFKSGVGGNPVQILSGDNSGWILTPENSSYIQVRRVDQSNTQVDVQAHVY